MTQVSDDPEPSQYTRELTIISNYTYRVSSALFGPPRVPVMQIIHIHTSSKTLINIKLIF